MEANTCGHLNLCRNGVITLPTRLSAHKCREVWSRITYEKKFVMPKHIQSPIFSETCEIIKLILLFKVCFIWMIYINIFFSIFRVLVVKSKLSNKILKYTILWHNWYIFLAAKIQALNVFKSCAWNIDHSLTSPWSYTIIAF